VCVCARTRERVYLEQYSTEAAVPMLTPDLVNSPPTPPPPLCVCCDQYYCKAAMKCREFQIAWYGLKKYLFAED